MDATAKIILVLVFSLGITSIVHAQSTPSCVNSGSGSASCTAAANLVLASPNNLAGIITPRKLVLADLVSGGIIGSIVTGDANGGLVLGGTCFLAGPGVSCQSTESVSVLLVATRSGIISKLFCAESSGPGGARTSIFTIRKNSINTAITCTINGGASPTCNDVTHTVLAGSGDLLTIGLAEQLLSTTTAPKCSFEIVG